MTACAVAAFYRFRPLADVAGLAAAVESACVARNLKGTVLLAPEGVNGALAGAREDIEAILAHFFADMAVNWSRAGPNAPPFRRLKVRAKAEVLTFGAPLAGQPVGKHVAAPAWNALLADPNVRVVDARNDYETAIGRFPGAAELGTANFGEFRAAVDAGACGDGRQPVAMYCTGGIRCEKASACLLAQGFEQVYQLDGGILGYLNACQPNAPSQPEASAPPPENRFHGECFVFDGRVALAADLGPGRYRLCSRCAVTTTAANRRCAACAAAA